MSLVIQQVVTVPKYAVVPEDGQDVWPKPIGVVYSTYKNTVQLVGGVICVL
jgi:hypothetical protein